MPDISVDESFRGYPALRRGRFSASGADYFLTICVQRPCDRLTNPGVTSAGLAKLREFDANGTWMVRCATFMPDHLHLLITLGPGTSLSGAVRKFKGSLTPVLRRAGISWQPSFYDQRLRASDDLVSVFLYIFLNPYRERLCEAAAVWPGYYCAPEDWSWFGALTRESRPEPEWLR